MAMTILSSTILSGNHTASRLSRDGHIASMRNRLERALFDTEENIIPSRNRQECLDRVTSLLSKGSSKEWVRFALDLATHTLFRTDTILKPRQPRNGQKAHILRITDFEHWDQMSMLLSEEYGDLVEELKLLLIAGSFVEMEAIVSREIDPLIAPFRATQDIEARIRYHIAEKPRGFDIESLNNLAARYNHTSGTPIHELIENGLSNVINLNSDHDICCEYQRIFVDRRSGRSNAEQGIPLFALSYKHESRELRLSKESFFEVCNIFRTRGFVKVQLWIDALLKESQDVWARRGLLPYTILPIVIHNNELYDKGKERIWLKLERVASSGRSGVLCTRPSECGRAPWSHYVTGDSRDLVAGCIVTEDYDPESVTFESDVTDLKEWAIEHLSIATFRSFLGISKVGGGVIPLDVKHECLYSGILMYNEIMADREVQCFMKGYSSVPHKRLEGRYQEIESRARARNERLMTFMCRLDGNIYHVRVNHGLGISVSRVNARRGLDGKNYVSSMHKVSATERQHTLRVLTNSLIHLADHGQDSTRDPTARRCTGPWSSVQETVQAIREVMQSSWGMSLREDGRSETEVVTLDQWRFWPDVFGMMEG